VAKDTDAVRALAEPIVDGCGLELVDVEVKAGRGPGLVRVVVDRKGGVPLGLCQDISRELSTRLDRLDDEDPVDGRYALEVTSPGVDWPLRDQRAFDRVAGREVVIHHRAREGGDGPSGAADEADGPEHTDDTDGERVLQATGRVVAAEEGSVRLTVDDTELRIAYDDIVKATQKLPW
jgi:ribosome maturation factor RimP